MKTKNEIIEQLSSYIKSYERAKDFEEFGKNIYGTILDVEKITPISPFFSTYLFQLKMDFENMEPYNTGNVITSLEVLLERLE